LTQPLTGIVSNADAGRRMTSRPRVELEPLRELLADISADGRRAGEIIHNIRRMVKRTPPTRSRIDVNDLVRKLVHMMGWEASLRSCELRTELDADLPAISGNPVEIQQILLNLVVNAFDAMGDSPASARAVVIATRRNVAGDIEMSVRDHGIGISEEVAKHLFAQFFTTKTGGLGMGLAIARSLVEGHGGTIAAANAEGGGAEFRFTLRVEKGAAPSPPPSHGVLE
jgi:signal transduction histidine kinase